MSTPTTPQPPARPRLGVFKFASCDGCQLTLLDCEDELLGIAAELEIAHFLEASSEAAPGPYDLVLVEGSVSTPEHVERIRRIRAEARHLVTIGACATAGGVQALRNYADVEGTWRPSTPAPTTSRPSRPPRRSRPTYPSTSNCAAAPSTAVSSSRSSPRSSPDASPPSRTTASASPANGAATSVSPSPTAHPASAPSPTRAAGPCARRTGAAATAASVRPEPRTFPRWSRSCSATG